MSDHIWHEENTTARLGKVYRVGLKVDGKIVAIRWAFTKELAEEKIKAWNDLKYEGKGVPVEIKTREYKV